MMILGRGVLTVAVCLILLFFISTQFIPAKILIELTRVVHVSIGFAVMISYWHVARKALAKGNNLHEGELLGLAIFASFLSHFLHGWWMLFWRLAGQPAWMVNSDVTAFTVSLAGLAGLFYLAAPGAIDGHVPPRQRIIIGAAFGIGFLLFGMLFIANVDLSGLADSIRWLIDDDDGPTLYGPARAFFGR